MTVTEAYRERIARGDIEADPMQAKTVTHFARLERDLAEWKQAPEGFLSWFRTSAKTPVPKGIYLHGAVGRGKSMLMDVFYEAAQVTRKRRIHFHGFMAETHERIGAARKTHEGDPIPKIAERIAKETRLLCFDELQVTDIADAMILGRLFRGMWDHGVVIVSTSNALPERLYWNGLNRQLFLPFIAMIRDNMEVVELDVSKDYRLEKLAGRTLFFTPLDDAARVGMDALWAGLTGSAGGKRATLEVKGRQVGVPVASMGAARFSFDDLCAQPLGSLDYLTIADAYHTVFIDDIPILTPDKRNEARRFINLIDTLYDERVGLVASSAAEPDAIYPAGDGAEHFERTVSRLMEMRSDSYLESREERIDLARTT